MGVCNCSLFCYTLLYVHSSIAIILMGKRELVALLNLSSWCLVMVVRLFLAMPRGCLRFVIVVFPDQTHLLFLNLSCAKDFQNLKVNGDLVYKLKKIVGSNSFSMQFIKIISNYKKIGYNITGPSKKLFHHAIFQKFFSHFYTLMAFVLPYM